MSPSWSEKKLLIGLAPDAVEYAYCSRGWYVRASNPGRISVTAQGTEPWRGAVAALAGALPRIAARRPTCTVVLSNHFTRCQVLPWHDQISSPQEYAALAHAQFRSIYGAAVDEWDIRLARAEYKAPVLACAVDNGLLRELDTLMAAAGVRLLSVQPHFAVAFDRWRTAFQEPAWWFALIEPGRLWLGRGINGTWASVSTRALGSDPVGETLAALDQEKNVATAAAGAEGPVHAVAMGMGRDEVHTLREGGLHVLGSIAGRRFDLGTGENMSAGV